MKRTKQALLLATLGLLTYCTIPNEVPTIDWSPEYLGPLVKSRINIDEFAAIRDIEGEYEISPDDLGIPGYTPGTPMVVPPIPPTDFPPSYVRFQEYFKSVVIDSGKILVEFENTFPIIVNKNTIITARDSVTKQTLFSHPINRDVQPGETYTFPAKFTDKTVSETIEFQVTNFSSPGSNNATFSGEPLRIKITIEFLKFRKLILDNSYSYELKDTSSLASTSIPGDSIIEGYIHMFMTHSFPVQLDIKMEFVDQNGDVIFKAFSDTGLVISANTVDAQGETVDSTILELRDIIKFEDIPKVIDAQEVIYSVRVSTGPSPSEIVLNDNVFMDVQLTTFIRANIPKVIELVE